MNNPILTKQTKFSMLLAIVSMMGMQAGSAYQIHCPPVSQIGKHKIKQFEYKYGGLATEINKGHKIKDHQVEDQRILPNYNLDLLEFFNITRLGQNNGFGCAYEFKKNGEVEFVLELMSEETFNLKNCKVMGPEYGGGTVETNYIECPEVGK